METIKIDFKNGAKVFLNTKYIINFTFSKDGCALTIVYFGGSENDILRVSEKNCLNFYEIIAIVNNLK